MENTKEVVAEFEGKVIVEVRRQKKLERTEGRDLRREELLKKYMTKMLYGWNDRKFEKEYLKKLERNWQK